MAANDDLELLLAAAAHVPEPCHKGRQVAGQHNGMLHEAAAAADQYAPGPPHFFSGLLVLVLASCSCRARILLHSLVCVCCGFMHLLCSTLFQPLACVMLIHTEVTC